MAVENRYHIQVNTKSKMFRVVPEIVANDNVVFEIELYDGATLFPLVDGYTYRLVSLKKASGTSVIRDGAAVGGLLVFELGTSEMTDNGKVEATVQVFDADNNRVSSAKFDYVVRLDPSLQGSLPADDTSLVIANESLLTDAINKADAADQRITDIISTGTQLDEVKDARGTYSILKDRLSAVDASLADITNKRNIGFITLKQLGIVADGVQVDYTFSGTGTTLDGKTRKRWISQSGKETANSNLLKQAIIDGWNIIVEKGNYVFDPKVLIPLRNNLTIQGFGDDCKVIGTNLQGWNSHLSFEKFMIEGAIDLTPPAQLEIGTETWFNNTTMFDIYNDLKFYAYDTGITRSPIGIWIQPQDIVNDVKTVENIQVIDVKFKNLQSGALFGDRDSADRGFRINNIYVNNCRTEQIWWHGFGTNNGKNHTVENCKSLNHYCGMVADFSRGTVNATINNCIAENCVNLSKSETNGTMLSDNHKIINNVFRYIDDGQPKYHYRDVFVIKVTGKAFIKNNELELWYTHEYGIFITSYHTTSRHVEVTGNRFIFNNILHPNRTYVRAKLFALTIMQMTNIANSIITVKDNTAVINTTTATSFIYARNKIESLNAVGNKIYQTVVSDFVFCFSDTNVDGEVKDLILDNNKIDACSYFVYSTREFTGKVSLTGNEVDTSSNTFVYLRPAVEITTTQNLLINNNKIKAMYKLLDILRLSTFGSLIIRGNQYALMNGITSGFYFMIVNNATLNIDTFIYEHNNFIDHSNASFTLSTRFNFLQINATNYSIKEFVFANNQCIMHEYFICLIGTGTGGNKLRVSNNIVEAKGAMDGRTIQFLYHTGTPFAKGMVANNEIVNNYTNTVNVNFYSVYKGLGKNTLDTSVTETA